MEVKRVLLPVSSSSSGFNIVSHRGTAAPRRRLRRCRNEQLDQRKQSVGLTLKTKGGRRVFISIRDEEDGGSPEVAPPWSFAASQPASDQRILVPGRRRLPPRLNAPQGGANGLAR